MKTLITGAFPLTPEFQAELERRGIAVTLHRDERAAVEDPGQFEAVVCNGLFLHNPIGNFTALRLVQLTSAGFDRMPMDEAKSRGIQVFNARGVYGVPMAEFALWGILELYKQGRFFLENQKAHRWEKHRRLLELAGKQVCVVGTGEVGSQIAQRLKAFGCRITGVNRTVKAQVNFDDLLPLTALADAAAEADILVLAIALTEETKALVSAAIPAAMKPGSLLVNVARGALVEENVLIAALKNKLAGAVLDVTGTEPLPPGSPLWDMENVILTPHNSFVGEGNRARLEQAVLDNLVKCVWRETPCCKKN